MKRRQLEWSTGVMAAATLLWAGAAPATPTAQQSCDFARITAWSLYQACVDTVVAKDAKGVVFDESAAFAKCRHTYFKKWPAMEKKASLVGSSCNPTDNSSNPPDPRYTDNGNDTVTDGLTGLTWEKKVDLNGTPAGGFAQMHDADNRAQWSAAVRGKEGEAFAFPNFLSVSGLALAGTNDWRLPNLTELLTIVKDFACAGEFNLYKCTCGSFPCVDPALDTANTQVSYYWTATSYAPDPGYAWVIDYTGGVAAPNKTFYNYVRAVRGGL